VDRLIKLPGRPGIFFCGEIIDGNARVGMTVQLPLRSASSTGHRSEE